MVLAVFAAALVAGGAGPASADHDEAEVWSADLTVAAHTFGIFLGCDNTSRGHECSSTGVLSDDDFTHRGTDYSFSSITMDSDGALSLQLDRVWPEVYSLHAGSVELDFADATGFGRAVRTWASSGLSWSEGDVVSLRLTGPGEPPDTGMVLSAGRLSVAEGGSETFTVALASDPGSSGRTVHLAARQYAVSGSLSGRAVALEAVSVSPARLAFTGGSSGNWETPQTVTVSAVQDDNGVGEFVIVWLGGGSSSRPAYLRLSGSDVGAMGSVTVVVDDDEAPSGYDPRRDRGGPRIAIDPHTGLPVVAGSGRPSRLEACADRLPSNAVTVSEVEGWRDEYSHDAAHVLRWNRVLAALGENGAGAEPLSVAESRANEARFTPAKWVRVTAVLRALQACQADQQQQQQPPPADPPQDPPADPPPPPANRAPEVAAAIADAIIVNEQGAHTVALSGVFGDADGDSLDITAASSNAAVAAVAVSSDGAALTVGARSRGTATITVTADDGNGGTVSDAFAVTVKAAPAVASPIADATLAVSSLRVIALSGVFADADGDALTVTAASSNEAVAAASVASDGASLTVTAKAQGTATITVTADDGNGGTVSDAFAVTVAAPPPEAEQPGIVARYDADGNGRIDQTEWVQAVRDFAVGEFTYAQLLVIIRAYLGG